MALQQCFSGGMKMLLTNLPRSSTHVRYLLGSGLSVTTQSWNNENTSSVLTNSLNKNPISKNAKWLCLKTLSPNYSQIHKDTSGIESSKINRYYAQDDYGDDNHDDDDDDIDLESVESQLEDTFTNQKELSSAEWEDIIKLVSLGDCRVNPKTCDAIIMKRCLRAWNYTLGTSYLEHLQQHGRKPNLSTLGSYLQLCGEQVAQCGEDRVLEYYHRLLSQTKVLDYRLSKNAVIAITATQEWRQALDLLPCLRKMTIIGSNVYGSIITAAFRAGDYELGWQLFETNMQETQVAEDSVFVEWIRQCDAVEDRTEKKAMALTLLQKLEDHEVYPSVAVAREVTRLFREGLGWSAHYLKIPNSGRCRSCKHQLEIKGLSEEEFRYLQEEFVPRVLLGSDIFRSTSPEEWSNFQRYVKENKPFSVVVDGLNSSYILSQKSKATRQQSLREVVEQALVQHPGGRVLVLVREHIKKQARRAQENRQRISVFTLNNMSKDDGFFLYAALQSGLGTKFITSDLLRDHKSRLREPQLRDAFRRWQRTHQVMPYNSAGRVRLMSPAKFSTVAQESQLSGVGSWHVPYDNGAPRLSYELPPTWLCLHPSLALAPPLPPSVSFEPLTYIESRKPNGPPLNSHHHRSASPKDDHFGVRYRNDYDPTARRGQQRQRQERNENSTTMAERLQIVVDDAAAPPKGQKRRLVKIGSSAAEVSLRMIFDKK